MQTSIFLVRHGETEANRDSIVSGHLDTPLTETGKAQARQTRDDLTSVIFDEVYSSDLVRAIDTAAIIAGRPVPESNRIHQLRERNFGELEGTPNGNWQQLQADHAHLEEQERWTRRFAEDIESDQEVGGRALLALQEIAAANEGKTVLVVAHGGCVRTVLVAVGHFKVNEVKPGKFRNGGYIELTYEAGNFRVERIEGMTDQATAE